MPDETCSPERVSTAIERFQAGDEAGFDLLHRCFRRRIEGFFNQALSGADERRDLTQETFLRVYRGLRRFRGDASFKTWLFRIAHNLLSETLRRQSTRPRLIGESALSSDPETERSLEHLRPDLAEQPAGLEPALRRERLSELRAEIEKLPAQMRQCLILRTYHEKKYREIAEIMKLSIETVKAHLYQARKKLEKAMTVDTGNA